MHWHASFLSAGQKRDRGPKGRNNAQQAEKRARTGPSAMLLALSACEHVALPPAPSFQQAKIVAAATGVQITPAVGVYGMRAGVSFMQDNVAVEPMIV